MTEICIGTAKLDDESYGYSSSKKRTKPFDFLEYVFHNGLKWIDTSPRYNKAEKVIGQFIKHNYLNTKPSINISTKVDGLIPSNRKTPLIIKESVERSLENLNIDCIKILYLHQNEEEIISDNYVLEGLCDVMNLGLVESVGTSVYSLEELNATSLKDYVYKYVQVPANITDTSFIINASKTKLKVVSRSVFLQGVIANPQAIDRKIPDYLYLKKYISSVMEMMSCSHQQLPDYMLAFMLKFERLSQVIVGTNSLENLKSMLDSKIIGIEKDKFDLLKELSQEPKKWTNPRNWDI